MTNKWNLLCLLGLSIFLLEIHIDIVLFIRSFHFSVGNTYWYCSVCLLGLSIFLLERHIDSVLFIIIMLFPPKHDFLFQDISKRFLVNVIDPYSGVRDKLWCPELLLVTELSALEWQTWTTFLLIHLLNRMCPGRFIAGRILYKI